MTDRELMQQALEALNDCTYDEEGYCLNPDNVDAILALRERLAQPEMQPCAGRNCGSTNPNLHSAECFEDYEKSTGMKQWQGLTEEEIESMMDYWSEDARSAYGGAHAANGEYVHIPDIIRDAEARLKEKNNG